MVLNYFFLSLEKGAGQHQHLLVRIVLRAGRSRSAVCSLCLLVCLCLCMKCVCMWVCEVCVCMWCEGCMCACVWSLCLYEGCVCLCLRCVYLCVWGVRVSVCVCLCQLCLKGACVCVRGVYLRVCVTSMCVCLCVWDSRVHGAGVLPVWPCGVQRSVFMSPSSLFSSLPFPHLYLVGNFLFTFQMWCYSYLLRGLSWWT